MSDSCLIFLYNTLCRLGFRENIVSTFAFYPPLLSYTLRKACIEKINEESEENSEIIDKLNLSL